MQRLTKLFLPTLREAPADAEALSHKLLVRGGYIRQVSAGLWTFLPLGWKIHRKVEQVIREELDAIGAQEISAPVLTPAELWQRTGRYSIPEIFHVKDRKGADYVLPITHEETFTFHALELQSYRQLPQSWYHFQTKDRDEPRPRGGLLRVREFVMKDSYSFDRDEGGLEVSFRAHERAYHRIFERCGIEYYAVQAESGMMGGTESIDFLAPSGSGENTLVTCENGDYAADLEIALGVPRAPELPARLDAPEEVETPDTTTIEALAELLGLDAAVTSKALPMTREDGSVVLALVRGDDRLEEAKLAAVLRAAVRPSTDEEIRAAFGAEPGYLGPVGFKGDVVVDHAVAEGQFVAGANRSGWHLRGDEGAIAWPPALAPFDVEVVALQGGGEELAGKAEALARELDAAGLDVLLDDREARPGEKFADADLVGAPIRITVGKKTLADGAVDVRRDGTDGRVPLEEVASQLGASR